MQMLGRIWAWIKTKFKKHPAIQAQMEFSKPAAKPFVNERAKDIEESGRFYFKRDVLDQLDLYFKYLKVLRKYDPESYSLCGIFGASIASSKTLFDKNISPSSFARENFGDISFGAIAPFMGVDLDQSKDTISVKFMCFRKMTRAQPNVQPTNATVFRVNIIYIDNQLPILKQKPIHGEFYVAVGHDKTIAALKTLHTKLQVIPGFKNSKSIIHLNWDYPEFLKFRKNTSGETPADEAKRLFLWAYGLFSSVNSDVRVRVSKNGMAGAFGVDLLRIPYFFKDRDKVVDGAGKTGRIFHIVRTHIRSNGSAVKSHFRGLREFRWNGYDILVTMPGRHHADILEARFGAEEYGPGEAIPSHRLSTEESMQKIANHMQS